MAIRAVLFDLGNTLFKLDPFPADLRPELAAVLRDVCAPALAETLAGDVHETIVDAWRLASEPGQTMEVDNAGTIEAELEDRIDADIPRLSRRLADVFGKADVARFVADEDCGDRVATFLDRGVRLGVVSNTSTRPELILRFMDNVGLTPSLFQVVLFSVKVGVRKPHPRIYARALAGIRSRADETLFVGDSVAEDVRGPMAAGMHAVLTHEYRQEAPGTARPAAIINTLLDLHEVLRMFGV